MKTRFLATIVLCLTLATTARAALTSNSWTDGSSKWETAGNWSLVTAPSTTGQSAIIITNAGNNTVTIDSVTAGTATMTISNLIVGANTLQLTNAIATNFRILSGFTINNGGALLVTNSILRVGLDTVSASTLSVDGAATILGLGQIITTNATTVIGNVGSGSITVGDGGRFLAKEIHVGNSAGASGTLIIAGGTNQLTSFMAIGSVAGSTGSVWLTSGALVISNEALVVGNSSVGQMTVSNGFVFSREQYVGGFTGAQGTLTIAGGTNILSSFLKVGETAGVTGTVWVTGGQLVVTNGNSLIGNSGVGQMTVSNGTVLSGFVAVGELAGSRGTLTIAGGTNTLSSLLVVGDAANATGAVWVTGGQLTVSNNDTRVGFSGVGRMTVSNGMWLARDVYVGFLSGSQGTLTVAGGTNTLSSSLTVGSFIGSTGTVWVTGGQLTVMNGAILIGDSGVGQMTVSNGTVLATSVFVGLNSSQGTLTVAGGTNTLSSTLTVGTTAGTTGTVWVTGGQLTVNGVTDVEFGRMTVSNGTFQANNLTYVGQFAGSQGTLTVAGGTNTFGGSFLSIGEAVNATGTVFVTGGQMTVNNELDIGFNGVGQMTVAGGNVQVGGPVSVAVNPSSRGTLTVSGGAMTLNGALTIGRDQSSIGSVFVTGGQLIANSTITIGRNPGAIGSVSVYGGQLIANSTMTIGASQNATGSVYVGGGQLIANGTTIIGGPNGGSGSVLIDGGTMFVRDVTIGPAGTLTVQSGYLRLLGTFGLGAGAGGAPTSNVHLVGGTVVVEPTGLFRLGTDVASLSVMVTNQGVVQVLGNNFGFNGGFDNQGYFTVNGSQIITVAGNMGNSGQLVINPGAVFSISGFRGQQQTGSIYLNGGGSALIVGSAWTNAGAVSLSSGAAVNGGTVQNAGLIEGAGGVNAPLVNNAGGTVRASGGLLALNGATIQNQAGGYFEATAGSTLRINRNLVNQGVINPQGGVIDLGANTLTNTGTLSGFGTYKAGVIVNSGRATFQGGNLNIQAAYINSGGSTTEVRFATAQFFGAVTNNGVFKNTGSDLTFFNTYVGGLLINDPATTRFAGGLDLGTTGGLVGGAGDVFVIGGNFVSGNPAGLDIADATLVFEAGGHNFTLAGTARIGTLSLDSGASVSLAGADLIVGVFDANANQFTTPETIYYDPAQNPALGGQTFALNGGGSLTIIPEPSSFLLVVAGVAALLRSAVGGRRQKRFGA